MDSLDRLKALWRKLGRTERALVLVAGLYAVLSLVLPAGSLFQTLVGLSALGLGSWVSIRLARRATQKALWRLRNRLLVAYLFIAVVPIVLILILAGVGARMLAGQIALYLVSSEFERQLDGLYGSAQALARTPTARRAEMIERIGAFLEERFPGIMIVVSNGSPIRYPPESTLEWPAQGWGEGSGVIVKDGLLFGRAEVVRGETEVRILAPLTRSFLTRLTPGLGEISLVHFPENPAGGPQRPRAIRLHDMVAGRDEPDRSPVPPAVNRFDLEVLWGTPTPIAIWESAGATENALLAVHSRLSAVLRILFSAKTESGIQFYLLSLAAALFLVVELISLVLGISITRTVTGAVHDLYEGTVRVQQGDFSHRIEVRGRDQIAELSGSFNQMTGNLERLLVVAKERERIQAELEIAREVQRQLYPKSVPALESLELRAYCNPARMVSGDYYDYQSLHDHSAVLAIGDVAGKGISAALLMATLQSSLRTQVRACLERAAAVGHDGHFETISTSSLVSRLNKQLYADTSPEKYATFYFSVYEDRTGALTYTNAGHLPPLLVRRGQALPLEVNGIVVGAFPFAEYGESRLLLEPGDLLVCYTDGITEPENEYGEMFGEQRLVDVLLRNAGQDPDRIIAAVMDSVQEWTGSPELQDDMTMIVAQRH